MDELTAQLATLDSQAEAQRAQNAELAQRMAALEKDAENQEIVAIGSWVFTVWTFNYFGIETTGGARFIRPGAGSVTIGRVLKVSPQGLLLHVTCEPDVDDVDGAVLRSNAFSPIIGRTEGNSSDREDWQQALRLAEYHGLSGPLWMWEPVGEPHERFVPWPQISF